jgi:hypothetical protein
VSELPARSDCDPAPRRSRPPAGATRPRGVADLSTIAVVVADQDSQVGNRAELANILDHAVRRRRARSVRPEQVRLLPRTCASARDTETRPVARFTARTTGSPREPPAPEDPSILDTGEELVFAAPESMRRAGGCAVASSCGSGDRPAWARSPRGARALRDFTATRRTAACVACGSSTVRAGIGSGPAWS